MLKLLATGVTSCTGTSYTERSAQDDESFIYSCDIRRRTMVWNASSARDVDERVYRLCGSTPTL